MPIDLMSPIQALESSALKYQGFKKGQEYLDISKKETELKERKVAVQEYQAKTERKAENRKNREYKSKLKNQDKKKAEEANENKNEIAEAIKTNISGYNLGGDN